MTRRRLTAALAGLAFLAAAAPGQAARGPTQSEAKAVRTAFVKHRGRSGGAILKVRISGVDPRFAAVFYSTTAPLAGAPPAKAGEPVKAPIPAFFKKGRGAKWKSVPPAGVPSKVKKDLGGGKASDLKVTGEVTDHLAQKASCTHTGDVAGQDIVDRKHDLAVIAQEVGMYHGTGVYGAYGFGSSVQLGPYSGLGSSGGWTSGGPDDYSQSTGIIYVDTDGWGIIEADLARTPENGSTNPLSVRISGYFICG